MHLLVKEMSEGRFGDTKGDFKMFYCGSVFLY